MTNTRSTRPNEVCENIEKQQQEKNVHQQKNLEINNLITQKLSSLVKEGAVSELQYLEHQTRVEEIKSRIKTNLVKLKYQEIKSPIDGIVFELQPKGAGYVAEPKVTGIVGKNKDGYGDAETIQATDPTESQTVTVRGTKAIRKDKKPVKATWY